MNEYKNMSTKELIELVEWFEEALEAIRYDWHVQAPLMRNKLRVIREELSRRDLR